MGASTRVLATKPVWVRRFVLLIKTTVSHALDGHPDVVPETRKRGQAAAGYRPNVVGRRLSRRASGMVALVKPATPGRCHAALFVGLAAAIGTSLAEADRGLTRRCRSHRLPNLLPVTPVWRASVGPRA